MFKNLNPSVLGVTGHQSEIIELALTNNFTGLDLNVVEFATRARLKGVPYARRLIDSGKIKLGSFALPVEIEADEDYYGKEIRKLPDNAQAAVNAGCLRAVSSVAPAGDGRPYHENFELHKRRYQEIGKILGDAGIQLGIGFNAIESLRKDHAFQFIHDLDALMLLVNMIGLPNVGAVIDVWDIFASGGSLDSIRKLPPAQIIAVNLADMPGNVPQAELEDKHRLLPGSDGGKIDSTALLVYLKSVGYEGPVTPRPSRTAFQTRRRDLVIKQASDAFDKVWKAAGLTIERRFVPSAAAMDFQGDFNM
jgi:sugar phosphate isomerase/epimerase